MFLYCLLNIFYIKLFLFKLVSSLLLNFLVSYNNLFFGIIIIKNVHQLNLVLVKLNINLIEIFLEFYILILIN
jgi:hypothetical protein